MHPCAVPHHREEEGSARAAPRVVEVFLSEDGDEDAAAFRFENTIVNLLEVRAAQELIDPAPVAARETGSRFQLTIWVDDADVVCAELASRGVELLNL